MFNNQYLPYQNSYMPNIQQPQISMQSQGGIQYVNGFESAKAYQIMPNTSVLLMDSSMDRFYVKKADASGFSTVDAYDFVKAQDKPIVNDYVSRAEFDELKQELLKYEDILKSLSQEDNMGNSLLNGGGNSNNIVNQFNQFQKQLGNQDPKMLVMNLLNSGKMTQEQYKQLQMQAKQLEPLLKGFMKQSGILLNQK